MFLLHFRGFTCFPAPDQFLFSGKRWKRLLAIRVADPFWTSGKHTHKNKMPILNTPLGPWKCQEKLFGMNKGKQHKGRAVTGRALGSLNTKHQWVLMILSGRRSSRSSFWDMCLQHSRYNSYILVSTPEAGLTLCLILPDTLFSH